MVRYLKLLHHPLCVARQTHPSSPFPLHPPCLTLIASLQHPPVWLSNPVNGRVHDPQSHRAPRTSPGVLGKDCLHTGDGCQERGHSVSSIGLLC